MEIGTGMETADGAEAITDIVTAGETIRSGGKKLPATGVLLAGGKSSRMGRNKAFLEMDGRTLIERSLSILDQTLAQVLISGDEALYGAYGFKVVVDRFEEQGPLAGLEAGLGQAEYDWCFFAACDMPFLTAEGICFLYQFTAGYDIVVPESPQGLHPLHAFYHRRCLDIVEQNIKTGRRRLTDIYPSCRVRRVTDEELRQHGLSDRIFTNVNTPEEWERSKREQPGRREM